MFRRIFSEDSLWGSARVIYHLVLVAVSATIALSLPLIINSSAKHLLAFWSAIGNKRLYLIAAEMVFAICLILLSNYIHRSWEDRRLASIARKAGLVFLSPGEGQMVRNRVRRLKEKQGFARDLSLIGSTGFRTFVDPEGELHQVVQNCRDARIMLLNPYSEGASMRAKAIPDPEITPELLGEQIKRSIDFLKRLREAQKNIKLKLYPDRPFLKLAILGDYIWVQHYHPGLDIQTMPKYVFRHDQNPGALYSPFYQYFLNRWNDPEIPEYDLETDELIYRDKAESEVTREKFCEPGMGALPSPEASENPVGKRGSRVGRVISRPHKARNHLSYAWEVFTDSLRNLLRALHLGGKEP